MAGNRASPPATAHQRVCGPYTSGTRPPPNRLRSVAFCSPPGRSGDSGSSSVPPIRPGSRCRTGGRREREKMVEPVRMWPYGRPGPSPTSVTTARASTPALHSRNRRTRSTPKSARTVRHSRAVDCFTAEPHAGPRPVSRRRSLHGTSSNPKVRWQRGVSIYIVKHLQRHGPHGGARAEGRRRLWRRRGEECGSTPQVEHQALRSGHNAARGLRSSAGITTGEAHVSKIRI